MDYGTDRDCLSFESDFDNRQITITMFPVSKRNERTFQAGSAEWDVAQSIYRQFAAEKGYDSTPPILGDSGDVWLVTAPISRSYSLVCGAAEVDTDEPAPLLKWIWIHPFQRGSRSDSTRQLWARLTAEYDKIVLDPPISPAMSRFLEKPKSREAVTIHTEVRRRPLRGSPTG